MEWTHPLPEALDQRAPALLSIAVHFRPDGGLQVYATVSLHPEDRPLLILTQAKQTCETCYELYEELDEIFGTAAELCRSLHEHEEAEASDR